MQENISNLLRLRRPVSGTAQYLAYVCGAASIVSSKGDGWVIVSPTFSCFQVTFPDASLCKHKLLSFCCCCIGNIDLSLSLFFLQQQKYITGLDAETAKYAVFFLLIMHSVRYCILVGVGVCVAAEEYSK